MSIELLERGAVALDDLVDEVVFVGGATIPLWITDPAAPPPRPTKDVDVIIEVATRSAYYAFEDQLRAVGFRNNKEVICRWHHPEQELVLDAMPMDATLLGFENEWQERAFPHAVSVELPSGASIRAVPPPFSAGDEARGLRGQGAWRPPGKPRLGRRRGADRRTEHWTKLGCNPVGAGATLGLEFEQGTQTERRHPRRPVLRGDSTGRPD